MPLPPHSGTSSSDMAVAGTIRQDISEVLLANLRTENNFLANVRVGPQFGDTTACRWVEDSLNTNIVKDNTPGGLTASAGSNLMTLNSLSDVAQLEMGAIIVDDTIGDYQAGEQIQVVGLVSNSTQIQVTRGYGGTTIVAHASGNNFKSIGIPNQEGSNLGRDKTKPRLPKFNLPMRFSADVVLTQEEIERSAHQYSPGVPDEMYYQYQNRKYEKLREINLALLYARQAASGGASTGGDFSTMAGVIPWLDGTQNTSATPFNAAGAILTDALINAQNQVLINQGSVPKWLFGGSNLARAINRIYGDRIRITQDETTRGFRVMEFVTDLQNTIRVLWDRQIADTAGLGLGILMDPDRFRIRPYLNSLWYTIQAPSFFDGDAIRMLCKITLDARNTGTDSGAASILMLKLGF
jgi:hypothetical protein